MHPMNTIEVVRSIINIHKHSKTFIVIGVINNSFRIQLCTNVSTNVSYRLLGGTGGAANRREDLRTRDPKLQTGISAVGLDFSEPLVVSIVMEVPQ